MTHKQQLSNLTFPQRGVIFSRILLLGVAAAATSVVTMVPARSARAQVVSPVSPTVVNPTSPGTPSIGGTSLSETTTTETTTTTGETTTTTTTTVTETTTTTTNTETEVGVEATTNVVDDTATTAVPPEAVELEVVQEAAPQNTGEIMTTATDTSIPAAAPTQETPTPQPPPAAEAPQQQAPQQQAAATSTVVEQFIFGTTIETLYLRGLAGRLGTSQDILLQTRVFQVVIGVRGNQTALLQAFQAALERAGIFNLAAYNNAAFADLIANSGNAELAMEIFGRLAANRLMLLSRLGGLSSLSIRRGLVGVRFARITVTQYVVYQGLGVRFNGFPRERKK